MIGRGRWLLGATLALIAGAAAAVNLAGCDTCGDPPPGSCFAQPGVSHQEACASCGGAYSGCKDGEWVSIPCVPMRDAGRPP